MVATRRMVQQDPTEDELASDPNTMLKKKPVRKATAKTTAAKSETATAKTRATRGKKAEPESQAIDFEDAGEEVVPEPVKKTGKKPGRPKKDAVEAAPEVEEEVEEPPKQTRATKAGSLRGKKAAATVDEEVSEPPKPTRATKSGTLRGRKTVTAIEEEAVANYDEPVEEKKPVKTTMAGSVRGRKAAAALGDAPALPAPEPRPTRGTRAAAPKAPLSPKKITQVSRAATRSTKNTEKKPAATTTQKAPAKGRVGTRKRAVSDENEVPDIHQDINEEDEIVVLSSTPVNTRKTRAQGPKPDGHADSEVSMSSRPTTPNDSTVKSLGLDERKQGEEMENVELMDDNEDIDNSSHREASEDELCGPKTPMKRGSLGAEARYLSSVQRTIRKYEEHQRVQTPARRLAVLGSQRGTPQTQKPYCKPQAPSSEVRPMTVSRGTDRTFVFPDLREGALAVPNRQAPVDEEDEAELSFVPDEDIIPLEDFDHHVMPEVEVATPSASNIAPLQLHSPPESESEAENEVENEQADVAMSYNAEDDGTVDPADIEQDPEETMIVDAVEEDERPLTPQPGESFETDDTFIITRGTPKVEEKAALVDTSDEPESADGSVFVHNSPARNSGAIGWQQPEAHEATITVNFNDLFSGARSTSRYDEVEEAPHDEGPAKSLDQETEVVSGAEMDFELEIPDTASQTRLPEEHPRRQTLNLNEFINVAALTEPTQALNLDKIDISMHLGDAEATAKKDIDIQNTPFENVEGVTKDEVMHEGVEAVVDTTSEEPALPHYALPTFAFDARRKSLPAISHRTPVKAGTRPSTSDGSSMPRIANPFSDAWRSRSRAPSVAATPVKTRPSTAHATPNPGNVGEATTPVGTPGERFPRLAPRRDYEEHARTVAPPARFKALNDPPAKRRETFHRAATGRVIAATPKPTEDRAPQSPSREAIETPGATETPIATPGERYPRLRPRADYQDHAKTVAAPVRFRTPTKTPLKRPATAQKPESLRKAALKANTPMASRSSMKTPLKPAAMTPGHEPMTPHPAAPLRGVLALVEVFTLEGASASSPFITLLHRLGAKTTKGWSDRVTHVIFKDGSPTTLQRLRLHNKDVAEGQGSAIIHCVNSRWVTDCDTAGTRMDESEEAYAVDVAEIPRGGKRRRKSMEPSALMNLGGNIIRDRKSSTRTPSFGRSPVKFAVESPAKVEKDETDVATTPLRDAMVAEKENSGEEGSSPVTPAWIAAPSQLVQQTAPMSRVRKLDLPGKQQAKSRRLTFWNEGA